MTDFPCTWNIRPLGKLVDVLDARRVPVSAKERAKRLGNVPYYGATGQVGWIDQALFDEPLVLLGEDGVQFFDGGKPKSYLIDGPAWVNNHAHVLRAGADIDRRFLNYYLNAADYRGFANGTTRLKLTQAAMRRIAVPVPPPDEQHRIVDLLDDHLSRLDAASDYLAASRRRLVRLERSALDAQFSGEDISLADLIEDISAGKSFGAAGAPARADEWGIIKVSAMTWGEFDPAENKAVTDEGRVDPRFEIRPGDLLVSRANTSELVGASVLVRDVRAKLLLSDKSLRLAPHSEVNAEWLWRALQAPSARRQISALATGTKDSMRNISQAALKRVLLPNVSIDEQAAALLTFNEVADAVAVLRLEIATGAQSLEALRRSLLAAAFSGRLDGAASEPSAAKEMINV